MRLIDVNVLVYAFREDAPDHASYAEWLDLLANGREAFGLSDLVLSGFLRIVTHARVFSPPTPLGAALAFVQALRAIPQAISLAPGPRHWDIFTQVCRDSGAKGNLVPDAWLAALAIESGSELITTDRDFARFAGLRWSHPLNQQAV
jgi:toxin-antitoxin system PIN domain toxin